MLSSSPTAQTQFVVDINGAPVIPQQPPTPALLRLVPGYIIYLNCTTPLAPPIGANWILACSH